ncbi:MAG: excalibur calcium-binding domain-containing protein [Aestuariivita sp.]|nr:excalibur calcium-binding domain-containing protein [Aestuariivita sp.]MCY4345944.1 excalibur calcium-binding domain-containing protein [Aestuariivita sp.]
MNRFDSIRYLYLLPFYLSCFLSLLFPLSIAAETWRGLTIAPENRCSPYERKRDYTYPQSIERRIAQSLGAIYSPYTNTCYSDTGMTDIEHMISLSEAHDSGLCAASRQDRAQFASDIRNLTLASPALNRHQKGGRDAGEWLPEMNRCWFANRVVEVRLAYGLTIDRREANRLEEVLRSCSSFDLLPVNCETVQNPTTRIQTGSGSHDNALKLYDDNRNGRITCKEARRHGIAPVEQNHPAYRFMRDGDGDGVVCE